MITLPLAAPGERAGAEQSRRETIKAGCLWLDGLKCHCIRGIEQGGDSDGGKVDFYLMSFSFVHSAALELITIKGCMKLASAARVGPSRK